jgi:CheY-like chemotaxis protein
MSKRLILLIDDDADFTASNRELLEQSGYSVASAPDGAAGIKAAREKKPDLVVLDVMMKTETEGFDVSRALHDDPELKGIPVILLTGIRKAMRLPFRFEPDKDWLPVKAVLEKPVQPSRLLEEIAKVVGG